MPTTGSKVRPSQTGRSNSRVSRSKAAIIISRAAIAGRTILPKGRMAVTASRSNKVTAVTITVSSSVKETVTIMVATGRRMPTVTREILPHRQGRAKIDFGLKKVCF